MRLALWVGGLSLALLPLLAAVGLALVFLVYGRDLPDYRQLAHYEPPVVTRVHAADGSLLTEYARQKRLFVPIEAMPKPLIRAFISAEDKNFYKHGGLDLTGIARASLLNVRNLLTGRRLMGASTITQQVAKNFLLTSEVSLERKIKEAILALRIERAFTKDQILELYLNEIYLGEGSYGVAAAALNYFDKALDELTLSEMAFLAALPKAPNHYHPVRHHERALARRNWVLWRMFENGYLDRDGYERARAEPLVPHRTRPIHTFRADYYEEEVRRRLLARFGEKQLYDGGLSVRTALEPKLETIAERVLRAGLIAYDRRHGWRGPLARRSIEGDWAGRLAKVPVELGVDDWRKAIVLSLRADGAVIGFQDGSYGFVPFETMRWARRWRLGERVGPPPKGPLDVLNVGDVIAVSPSSKGPRVHLSSFFREDGEAVGEVPNFALEQVPEIEGALVALDPHTGRVLALVGGFSFARSQFNRATQAMRQAGSAFKPFVYAAALEAGFTPSSLVLDAPFVIDQGDGQGKWKPRNYSGKYYGPSTLRRGLELSRNLMTVRIAQYIGMKRVIDMARRFGLDNGMEPTLAQALGAGEVTPLQLTTAYAMLVNGGRKIAPSLIDRIQDRRGRTIYRHDARPCPGCDAPAWSSSLVPPRIPDDRPQILDPRIAYQVVHMLEGVVEHGTGRAIRSLPWPLAGKTGTSNDAVDTWFVGFSPDLVVGVFVGFDRPRGLGPGEQGASTAVPIFKRFMAAALKGSPPVPFRIPPGIRLVRVDPESGLIADPADDKAILEAFLPGTEPKPGRRSVIGGAVAMGDQKIKKGTGGLY
ncbi:MAG: penicillin-binding protein 1A [Alphaproteobacteria bacterium]|nr:MAG: penicillin-binding protein 1A [Alphaproteobacteria bacterium]